jgi:hypothetical protein
MSVHGKVKTVPASAYFKLCERVTEQIVFPEDGFDADFDNFRFNQIALIEVSYIIAREACPLVQE